MYLHYTSNKIDRYQTHYTQHPDTLKPIGMWGSWNTEWRDWCNENEFSTFDLNNYYTIQMKIKDFSKILVIDSLDTYLNLLGYCNKLNWKKVAKKYDGVVVKNYNKIKSDLHKTGLLDTFLYSLDVNCCCIWNLECVELIHHEHVVC
jgi:hypothetical protein